MPASGRSGRWGVHRARGAESREGIKPSHAVLQTALLSENRLGAGRGNRTHIGSLEDCGPTVERCPREMEVESARLVTERTESTKWTESVEAHEAKRSALASPGCKPDTLPLSYDPAAGREGIEPSLRVLEARLVTMTLRPVALRLVGESNPSHPMDSGAATPVASRGKA